MLKRIANGFVRQKNDGVGRRTLKIRLKRHLDRRGVTWQMSMQQVENAASHLVLTKLKGISTDTVFEHLKHSKNIRAKWRYLYILKSIIDLKPACQLASTKGGEN